MRSCGSRTIRFSTWVGISLLVLGVACRQKTGAHSTARARAVRRAAVTNVSGTPIQLTAQRMTVTLRDGTTAPMWGFCDPASCATQTEWAPGPTIVAAAGDSLQISLSNMLPAPTSLVILGQLGGGVGTPQTMNGPPHTGQSFTTFPGNSNTASAPFVPPAQGPRVRSFGAEAAAATTTTDATGATITTPGAVDLTWNTLRPGTYLYETGTMPSLEVPMGLYGVLVVTTAPARTCSVTVATTCTADAQCPTGETCSASTTAPGTAYPGVSYDADATLLFSEIDPVQNKAVDAAAVAGTDPTLRFDSPSCNVPAGGTTPACYPAAVNYTPTYFLINGAWFDKTLPQNSQFLVGDGATYVTGNVLVRLLNAGSRTHVPSIVGLPMALVAEDGNAAPGNPKVQNEVLLTAGKTYDAIVKPAANGAAYASGTYPVLDRALFLSTDNHPDGGMQGFLLVSHAAAVAANAQPGAAGMLPAAIVPVAVNDTFSVPYNGSVNGDVTANDTAVSTVALGTGPSHGTVLLNGDGTFTYTPATGFSGTDSFTYSGNGGAAGTATVTLTVAALLTGAANMPVAVNDAYTSAVAGKFSTGRPGVLANDSDPNGYPLTAGFAIAGSGCTVALNADGSFAVTGSGASCQFTYQAVNSQGNASASATATVTFGTASGLAVTVSDAATGAAVGDYRWTLQEDLTFKHGVTGTPSLSTRTIGTSFHRSHMPVVATGCVGPVSCGSGQSVRGVAVTDAQATANQTTPDQVALDPTKNYYLSILPGDDVGPPAHAMGGAEVRAVGGKWPAVNVRVQPEPLVTSQMSIYIYEDNQPTNGQNELSESPLGGFNIILMDPAGRTGDVAGQQTYDAFNMPLSNALLGAPGCPDELNHNTNGSGTSPSGNLVGAVYTCPNDPNDGTPAADPVKYALAGHALIKNLTPARYDVIAHPGAAREGAGEVWWQTETLEGTPAQDAFVGINEPIYFQEFGPPGPHVTIGFVNPAHVAAYASANGLTGTATIKGRVTNQRMSRPSAVTLYDSGSYDALSSTTCEVALNTTTGDGAAIAAAECAPDGSFVLPNLPPGTYDLEIFDQWLDQIIQSASVTVAAGATKDLGDIPVLSWFTQQDLNIYQDLNKNGVYDDGEPGISNVPLSVRFRNGAPSNVTLSDSNGNGILVELFPLFNWYVTEADTTRFKQTGVHVVVDGGGPADGSGPGQGLWSSTYAYAPDGPSARTEIPGAAMYGIQGFISQRNRVDWGRTPYVPGENGGILGTVVYSSTRPFDDMRFNLQTIWEPLVPRVTVNLYQKKTLADGTDTLVLVDTTKSSSWDDFVNLVSGADGNPYLLGSDNLLRDPSTGTLAPAGAYPPGAQVNLQCPGQSPTDPFTNYTLGASDRKRCYDGWHNWNQVQAAPYDGRYAFPSPAYIAAHPLTDAQKAAGQTLVSLPVGTYVVEAVTPPGYEIVKEEDKNILIGDFYVAPVTQQFGALASIFIIPDQATLNNANPYNPSTGDPGFQSDPTTNLGVYTVSTQTEFPECVGNLHRVPDFLSLYPQAQQVAPFAGMDRPLCDRKKVVLNDQMQSSAFFFVFTEVPVAANNTGIILDDATSEFNAAAPDFGEKASVPFVPVSIKDFSGLEIGRTYSDQWGAYNMMTPSSWLVNPPTPSGYGPNMLVTCMNDPGPIPDPTGAIDPVTGQIRMITDPSYNPAYSNFCYTNPFMPGQTTYLDTPVLPIAAFASGYNPADCAYVDNTPAIARVDSSQGFGPYLTSAGGTLTITALGDQQVQNPAYAGPFATGGLASQKTITRHYGFGGAPGTVKIGAVDVTAGASWSDASITVNVPPNTPTGELSITTSTGQASVDTVTVNIENRTPIRVPSGGSIQAAIDTLANPGDLVLIDGGTYNELVIMYKPVRLQGVGAAAVIINAAKYPTSKLEAWRPRINQLFNVDPITGNQLGPAQVDPLPTQEITGGVVLLEPTVLGAEEGAGITVLAKNLPVSACVDRTQIGWDSNFSCAPSRIDGVSVTGGDAGGGIYVNGWAHGLEISNNRVYGNAGAYHGGVRVGLPNLELENFPTDANGNVLLGQGQRIAGFGYDVGVRIHHNAITKNGTVEAPVGNGGAGGGLSICAGTDGYSVDHNFICGNYSASDGGGIGHIGFSQGGTIAYNQILFNQSFQQTNSTSGGGIFVGGEAPIAGTVSLGAGDLTIDANLIRGNFAEGGHGGGIRFSVVNGADVAAFNQPGRWHRVTVTNNMIVDNVAGWAGGGISLADTIRATIDNDTIAFNDSTGIAGVVLAGGVPLPATTPGQVGVGYPSPSGIVSEPTSTALLALMPNNGQRISNAISQPELLNDIVWRNRSFYYSGDGRLCAGNNRSNASTASCVVLADQATTGACPSGAAYWDLGVLGDNSPAPAALRLSPSFAVLTSTAGYGAASNVQTDPNLANAYCNGSRVVPELGTVTNPPSVLNLQVAATLDEGNNYVNLRYGPLYVENPVTNTTFGDYHLASAAGSAYNTGTATGSVPNHDFDAQPRPMATLYDRGADEFSVSAPSPTVSPTALAFGNVQIGTFKTLQVTVSNGATATANLVLSTPTITGLFGGRYAVAAGTCPIGGGLVPGTSCALNVTFTPNSILPLQPATLNVSFANAATVQVALSGRGVNAATLTPASLTFAARPRGSVSPAQFVTLTNPLGNPVLTGITLTFTGQFRRGTGAGAGTCGANVLPLIPCTVGVVFAPTGASPGPRSGTLNVSDGVGVPIPQTVTLTGTAQ